MFGEGLFNVILKPVAFALKNYTLVFFLLFQNFILNIKKRN